MPYRVPCYIISLGRFQEECIGSLFSIVQKFLGVTLAHADLSRVWRFRGDEFQMEGECLGLEVVGLKIQGLHPVLLHVD